VQFHYVFTGTGYWVDGTYEMLDCIEEVTGNSIIRIKPKYDLFEMIERQGHKGIVLNIWLMVAVLKEVVSSSEIGHAQE